MVNDSPTAATPVAPQPMTTKPKRNMLPLVLVAIVCIAILILSVVAVVVLVMNRNNTSVSTTQTDNSKTSQDTTPPAPERKLNRIAYISNGNLWMMNADGSGKKQLTTDGSNGLDSTIRYMNVAWHNTDMLSYVMCLSDVCNIYDRNINTGEQKMLRDIKAAYVYDLSWSHNQSILAYYYDVKADSRRNFEIFKDGKVINAIGYKQPDFSRDGTLNDGFAVKFSNDDKNVVLFNTLISDTPEPNEATIIVFDTDGNLVRKLPGYGTFPAFVTADDIYYKNLDDSKLYSSKSGAIVSDFGGYNMDMSNDGSSIAYFTYDDVTGNTKLMVLQIAGLKTTQVADNVVKPQWLNTTEIVGFKSVVDPEGAFWRFTTAGLVKVNKDTKEVTVLESQPVIEFEIEGN